MSWMKAAEIVGCSHETVRRAVNAGLIEKRDVHRTQASLSRESVYGFRQSWRRSGGDSLPPGSGFVKPSD